VASLVSFFLSPFVVRHLGNSAYGFWVLIGSLTGYLGLFDLGVRAAVTRYVSRYFVAGSHEEASRTVSSALGIFLAAGTAVVVVSLLLANLVTRAFHIPEAYHGVAPFIVVLCGCSIAVTLVSGVFGGVVAGLQRFDWQNSIDIVAVCLRTLAVVVVLSRGKGLLALAVVHLLFGILTGLTYVWASFRLYPQLQFKAAFLSRQHVKLIFSFGLLSILLDVSRLLVFYTDSVVIGAFLPVALITFFAIAGNLVNYARDFVRGISTTMLPLASAIEARGGLGAIQSVVLKGCRFATLTMAPIAATFLIRGGSFIGLWMGVSYADPSGRVLWILSLGLLFVASGQVGTAIILGLGKHGPFVPVALGEAFANLLLSIVLVRPWGIYGVAWGTVLPSLLVGVTFWPWYFRRTLAIPLIEFVWSTWVRPAIAMIPFAASSYAIERFWPATNLVMFFAQVGALLPVALLGAWFVALVPEDRRELIEKLLLPILPHRRQR
jgi:O-antigen/teichoic acid export membrane protein